MAVGLYKLVNPRNGELDFQAIESFLEKPNLDQNTRERVEAWAKEYKFWNDSRALYPYMEIGAPFRLLAKTMCDRFNPSEGQVWLDAGCGPARMSEFIWEKSNHTVSKIVGLDIILWPAKGMAEKVPVLELKGGNLGERLDFDDNYFDGIVCNLAITYITEFEGTAGKNGIQKIFHEFARVLKPGGQLVWSTIIKNLHCEITFICATPSVIKALPKMPNIPIIAAKLYNYGKKLEKKGKDGLYTLLQQKEWDEMVANAGFINSEWKSVYIEQAIVNSCHLPS